MFEVMVEERILQSFDVSKSGPLNDGGDGLFIANVQS